MDDDHGSLRATAARHMRRHMFADAVAALSDHLHEHPDDLQALLELGICHLLNRSEQEFIHIHQRAGRLLAQQPEVQPELGRLWKLYRSLVPKLAAGALVVGAAAASGCNDPEPRPTAAPQPAANALATAAQSGTESTARPSAEPNATPAAPVAPATTVTATPGAAAPAGSLSPPPTVVRPAHRYSGGVRPPMPTPAHRYSGGVIRR